MTKQCIRLDVYRARIEWELNSEPQSPNTLMVSRSSEIFRKDQIFISQCASAYVHWTHATISTHLDGQRSGMSFSPNNRHFCWLECVEYIVCYFPTPIKWILYPVHSIVPIYSDRYAYSIFATAISYNSILTHTHTHTCTHIRARAHTMHPRHACHYKSWHLTMSKQGIKMFIQLKSSFRLIYFGSMCTSSNIALLFFIHLSCCFVCHLIQSSVIPRCMHTAFSFICHIKIILKYFCW